MNFAWLVWALLHLHTTALANASASQDLLHSNFTPHHTTTDVVLPSIATTVVCSILSSV
jgi:hypothetical protein